MNCPILSSSISQYPAYDAYVSQLKRQARASSAYGDFLVKSSLLTSKLVGQDYNVNKFNTYFKKCLLSKLDIYRL